MKGIDFFRRNPVKAFVVGFIVVAIAIVIALRAPSVMFQRNDWFDGGIRLLRDDNELAYYFSESYWIDSTVRGDHLPQDYPPLGVLYFSLPRLIGHDPAAFALGFVSLNALMYALLFGIMASLLEKEGFSAFRLLFFLLPAFLYFSIWRFDILPAVLSAGALLAAKKKSPAPAFLLLFAAVTVKWYAALFFPAFFIYFVLLGGKEVPIKRLKIALLWTAGAAAALVVVMAAFAGFNALSEPILFHLSRDFENGSVGSALLIGLRTLGIDRPVLHAGMAKLFFFAQFAAGIPVVWKEHPRDFRSLARSCVFVLIPFIALGLIFSPQWIVWLTPLLLLVADRTELRLLVALDMVIFLQFPVLFGINPYGIAYMLCTVIRTGLFGALWLRSYRALSETGAAALQPKNSRQTSALRKLRAGLPGLQ